MAGRNALLLFFRAVLEERHEVSCYREFNFYIVAVKVHIYTLDIVRLSGYNCIQYKFGGQICLNI